jgi:hypothetical protein
MNERIKLLAIQARLRSPLMLQYWGKIDALTDSEQEELENIEKFAQLIVRECIAQCNDGDSQYFIAKHFGDLYD